jgi:CubicO group peptidase (beta-lactamase class C family)
MTVETLMPLGSLSRAFTIIAIMQLVEQGKLRLDGTLAEYLPWVKLPDDSQNEITVEQLIKLRGARGYGSGIDLSCNKDCTTLVSPTITTKGAYIESLMPEKLKLTGYSQMIDQAQHSAIIMSLIIEKVTGMTFEDYMKANIFTPLQLNATYDLAWARQNGLAVGYSQMSGTEKITTQPYFFPEVLNPYAGIIMNSQDIAKFLIAVLDKDAKILKAETWESLSPSPTNTTLFSGLIAFGDTLFGSEELAHLGALQNLGIHLSLLVAASLLLNEEVPFDPSPLAAQSLPNPLPSKSESVIGTYASPLGVVEVFAVGEELHGKVMGHEFKLEDSAGNLLSRSDYKALDGLQFNFNSDFLGLNTTGIPFPFAYRIEDEGN